MSELEGANQAWQSKDWAIFDSLLAKHPEWRYDGTVWKSAVNPKLTEAS